MSDETKPPRDDDPLFAGSGEVARLMRAKDWPSTALGPPQRWPRSLRTTVRILLTSRFSMWMGWGPELNFFYNDAYRPTLGPKHPSCSGIRPPDRWAETSPHWSPRTPAAPHRAGAPRTGALPPLPNPTAPCKRPTPTLS